MVKDKEVAAYGTTSKAGKHLVPVELELVCFSHWKLLRIKLIGDQAD